MSHVLNIAGVPQAPKQQSATPWGNHTPAHPADYKTWGEPDEDPGAVGGDNMGGGGRGMPPPPAHPGNSSWGGLEDQQAPAWEADRGEGKQFFKILLKVARTGLFFSFTFVFFKKNYPGPINVRDIFADYRY